ncbi:hypothetical protein Nepgr_023460 [Nepenthes gracilis]|uniref:Uncharacterized protein n=1 Tax=Nepenthes gracilis TaxID=150966 RepID=A0AAD3T0S0_NEPGR|nr:hypothetical protein Nepgr_023460 [Nepenthes gracilis]
MIIDERVKRLDSRGLVKCMEHCRLGEFIPCSARSLRPRQLPTPLHLSNLSGKAKLQLQNLVFHQVEVEEVVHLKGSQNSARLRFRLSSQGLLAKRRKRSR